MYRRCFLGLLFQLSVVFGVCAVTEGKQRLQLFVIHDDSKSDMHGGSVGYCSSMLHYALQLSHAVVLVNKNLWKANVERIAEYAIRAQLPGTPEQLIKGALDRFTETAQQWYAQLADQDISEYERWSAALHQARSQAQLCPLLGAIKEQRIGPKELAYAVYSAMFYYAPYKLDTRVMVTMPGDYYCFFPSEYIGHADTIVEDDGSVQFVLPEQDYVQDPYDAAECLRIAADQGVSGQTIEALEHLLKAQHGQVIWDVCVHAHGIRYDITRPGHDGLWRIVAGLGMQEICDMLSVLDQQTTVNMCIIGTCFSGGQTAYEIAQYARKHEISFPIMTSTAFDSVSSCSYLVQHSPFLADGSLHWDLFIRLFCQEKYALKPFKGQLFYRPDIPDAIFESCPCPMSEETFFGWLRTWQEFVPPAFENIPSVIFPGKDPLVFDERKITSLDVFLSRANKQPLRYGSSDCRNCIENECKAAFARTCVLLEAPYIDCQVHIAGMPRIISLMPHCKRHYIEHLVLEHANAGDVLDMVFQLEGCSYECYITVDTLELQMSESLAELIKHACKAPLDPAEPFTLKKVLIWVTFGYQGQPSLYAMLNESTVIRINRIAAMDKGAKHPYGYQVLKGDAVARYMQEFAAAKEVAFQAGAQDKNRLRYKAVTERMHNESAESFCV